MFQSLGRVGGGSDAAYHINASRMCLFQSLGRVGGGSDHRREGRRYQAGGFNPSDGLGVVRTARRTARPNSQRRFQSLGRVGGGSDRQRPDDWRRRLSVSIPRTGWGWFGLENNRESPESCQVSIPRTGWGWFGLATEALIDQAIHVSIPRTGWGWFGQCCIFGGATRNTSFNPSDGLGVVRTPRSHSPTWGRFWRGSSH